MEYKKPEDLPYDFSPEMDDLWTIFTTCPIEKGTIKAYMVFAQAREQAFNLYKKKDLGQEM